MSSFSVSRRMLGRVGANSRGVTLEEGVEPWTVYEVKLTADTMDNTSAIFFQIKEIVTDAQAPVVRAEEITLVLLVLLLWIVAIILFVHRWGKIRMLEPYQPEYKPLNHSPACPLAPTTPTQSSQPRPPNQRPLLPRKSSSLCFTPSMLRSVEGPAADESSLGRIWGATERCPVVAESFKQHHTLEEGGGGRKNNEEDSNEVQTNQPGGGHPGILKVTRPNLTEDTSHMIPGSPQPPNPEYFHYGIVG
ncbi:uncharacterized protein LOC135205168 [Macrobrachium nipponense]|uniref:uncharacterized protein LOC135205168 n=1 Tax=Macrobrachium nipponense TaxID=159736 RepID=UPI0030C85DB8